MAQCSFPGPGAESTFPPLAVALLLLYYSGNPFGYFSFCRETATDVVSGHQERLPMNEADQSVLSRASVESEDAVVRQWLGSLEAALRDTSTSAIAALFARDSHWRDLLAFTWSLTPHSGADQIAAAMARL